MKKPEVVKQGPNLGVDGSHKQVFGMRQKHEPVLKQVSMNGRE